jgi:LmbE family N-acetylglucosaminyl deacetylase
VADEEVSLTVDVGPVWEQKLAAIRCHASQSAFSPILAALPEHQRLFLDVEHFRRAAGRSSAPGEADILQRLKDNNL